jgi:hypothetical protein
LQQVDGSECVSILQTVLASLRALFVDRAALAVENLALRQQLAVLHRSVEWPKLHTSDRILWSWLLVSLAMGAAHHSARDGCRRPVGSGH